MTKIAFLCDWGVDSEDLLQRFLKQTPNHDGKWKKIQGAVLFKKLTG